MPCRSEPRCDRPAGAPSERETDPKRRPLVDLALDVDRSAVQPDQFLNQGEPDTRAFVRPRPRP